MKERLYITAYPRKFEDRVLEDILCRFGGLIDAYFSKGMIGFTGTLWVFISMLYSTFASFMSGSGEMHRNIPVQ